MKVVYRQLILMLNQLYSTSHMVVLSNIRSYSDYDFFNGHRMQSGGRKGIRFYLMDMECMLSTSEWLVCEIFTRIEAVEFDVVGFFFCIFYFSDSTSTSTSTASSMKLHY
ncbi:hypothetical protein Tco_0027663, partial [Tanacetum coccineum]